MYQCNCTDIDLPNPHYPSKSTISLPPLSKVRCCRPKNSGGYRRDCHTNLALHPTLPNPYYPSKIANTLASLVKGEVLSPEKIRATTGGIVTLTFATHPTLPKPHYPTRFSCCEFDSPTSHKNKIRPRFHGGKLISISISGVWGVAPMWVVGRWCRCVRALTAICAVASCNGFVWLSLCILA